MKKFQEKAGGGPKYEQAAKGGSLAKGTSHEEKFNATESVPQPKPGDAVNYRMPKGSDRI